MPTIQVPPDILDKALAVLVDDQRAVLAVWKGRGRIDLHDLAGSWHETSHPYPRDEEGMWSRDDILRLMAEALAAAEPPRVRVANSGLALRVEVGALCRAALVRATALGYALWDGQETIAVHGADGRELRTVRVPPGNLLTMSQLMLDLLELSELIAKESGTDEEQPPVPSAHPSGGARRPRIIAGA